MKNILTNLFLLSIMVFATTAFGQRNFNGTLEALLGSEFMKQYQEIRTSAMASATAFKNSQGSYDLGQVQRVEEGYNKVADKFNFILLRLKNDMLSKDKMKYIEKFPEEYQRLLKLDMIELRDFYAVNYQQVLAEVTNDEVDGVILLLIGDLLLGTSNIYSLVKNMVEYIKFNKRRSKKLREAELDKRLIEPHKFAMWYELGRESMDRDSYDSRGGELQAPSDNVQFERIEIRSSEKGMPDKDGDGVADTEDRCPNDYGSSEAFGCPDSDKDGVPNDLDKCPFEYGFGNKDGCPDDNQSFSDSDSDSGSESRSQSASTPPNNGNLSSNKNKTDEPASDIHGVKLEKDEKIKLKIPKKKKKDNR